MFFIYHPIKLKYQASSYEVNNLLYVFVCGTFYVPYILLQIGQQKTKAVPVCFHFACTFVYSLSFSPDIMG